MLKVGSASVVRWGWETEEHALMGPLATSNAIPWINHTDGACPETPHFCRQCINLKPSKKFDEFLYHMDVKELQMELILGVYEVRQLFMFLFSLILTQLTCYKFTENKWKLILCFKLPSTDCCNISNLLSKNAIAKEEILDSCCEN